MTAPGERYLDSDADRTVYSTDNSIYQLFPAGIVVPADADELHRIVAANAAHDEPATFSARGGGTGTNGQSLTTGLMIDCKRAMNQIVDIDVENRIARVQPGVVAQRLNDELAAHGLHWAPHTSTVNRATVGGMIATDAAGKGSLVHGRTHRHVEALEVCLADGSRFRAEPVTIAEAERRATAADSTGRIWRELLALNIDERDTFDLPELARGFSGYGIDRLRHDGLVDPLALLVGSEGTLAITTEATLHLTPLASNTVLIVAVYPDFATALEDAVELRETKPTAIETFDEQTLAAGRMSEAWSALGAIVDGLDGDGAVLVLEYDAESEIDARPLEAAIAASGRSLSTGVVVDSTERAKVWKVRADAVGLLGKVEVGGPELSARPTAMVEDCAVPVASMVEFIADFRAVLDGFGLTYGMFGHADVGCVHVRPALDVTDPDHQRLVGEVTDAVVEIVSRHGGILWGEHGRGVRGDVASAFFSEDVITMMRRVKTIFDPDDLLNPGKLYRPLGVDEPILGLTDAPMRGQRNRAVPVEIRREFSSAFACNGNGLCMQHRTHDVMCPSYKATRDPALSPKGRSDLIREVLHRQETGDVDAALEDAVAANLEQCLSCAACSGTCPIEVDIPELKSRFFERHYAARRRPVAHTILSRFEQLAALAGRTPGLAAIGARPVGRLLGLVDLPTPTRAARKLQAPTFRPNRSTEIDIVIIRDVFTSILEPDTLAAAAEVLKAVGLQVEVSRFVPSGKFDHVKGMRSGFSKAAVAQGELIRAILDAGAQPVVIEPAIAVLHDHDYPKISPDHPTDVRHFVEVLDEHRDQLGGRSGEVTLLGHCTERAMAPRSLDAWQRVLEAAGYDVERPSLGCCGMAGIFGHETGNQDISRALWSMDWDALARTAKRPVATGYSCRSQSARLANAAIPHPVHLL